jgi:hypothetical protein
MLSLKTIPLPARAALATIVAAIAARYGVHLTDSTAAAVIVAVLWAIGGIVELVVSRRSVAQ